MGAPRFRRSSDRGSIRAGRAVRRARDVEASSGLAGLEVGPGAWGHRAGDADPGGGALRRPPGVEEPAAGADPRPGGRAVPPAPQPVPPRPASVPGPDAGAGSDAVPGLAATMPPPPEDVLKGLDADERNNVRVYAAVNKSVVNITTEATEPGFFGDETSTGSGSGFVIDKAGHILTNFHVVEGADAVRVTLFDGSHHDAQVVGADASNDVAVLSIDVPAEKLVPVALRRLVAGPGRPEDPGAGQPVRPGADADHGDHQQPGPLAQGQERPDDQGDHPDRRGDQPRQLGRPAAELARRGDRHEHGDHQPGRPVGRASASPCRSTRSGASSSR